MSKIDLAVLSIFVRAAELRSFSRTAVALGTTQPSVSRPIAELETALGGALFYRTGRGISLTELGEALLPRARALLDGAGQLVEDAQAFGRAPTGPVTVAALPSMMAVLAPQLFQHLRSHAPGIRLKLLEGFSDQVERWLSEGTADIGLLARYRPPRPGQDEALYRARVILLRGQSVPPLPPKLPFAALAGLPLVLPSRPNALRVILEETARKQKVSLEIVLEADSLEAQREVVRSCGCYTVVAEQALQGGAHARGLLASEIDQPELTRYVTAMVTQQRPLSRASRVVLQALRNFRPTPPIETLPGLATILKDASGAAGQTLPRPR